MKILELSIEHVRGIHSLNLSPQARNLVIWGPNGSGKSAVVDAVDFLLTGEISRLTGKGTGDISLKKHGPHIDATPSNARVSAVVQIPGIATPIQIARCMKQPKHLECEKKYLAHLDPVLEVAHQHQHVLSRRELLQFITAEPSSRAEEIQQLLSLTEVEKIRATLVRAKNDAEKCRESEEENVKKAEAKVADTVGLDEYDESSLLDVVNQRRAVLGVSGIAKLLSTELKSKLALPKSTAGKQSINVSALEDDFRRLRQLLTEEAHRTIENEDAKLRESLDSVRSDEKKRQQAARLSLFESGLPLVPDSGECPLCEKPWPPGSLREQLEARIASAKSADAELKHIDKLSRKMCKRVETAVSTVEKIEATLLSVDLESEAELLQTWKARLTGLVECLKQPLERYSESTFPAQEVSRLLAERELDEKLADLLKTVIAKFPEATPEQSAWDTLTQVEVSLGSLEDRRTELAAAKLAEDRTAALLDGFIKARDDVLGELYSQISGRFAELYSELHASDEAGFDAALKPEGAGLTFEVDFFGRGVHPPHALHSEGHQDSMGLCLYLALAEHLVGNTIELTILDDVVMSVDAEHRRAVCGLLAKHFPDRQFLITTHDRTWANQCRTEGIVNRKNIWEFYKWDIDTGPYVNLEPDLWSRIDDHLDAGDVNGAAALLRRGSEQFFAYVCDLLEAPVRYSMDGRNDLGEFLPAAVGRLCKLLDLALKAAKSWSDTESVAALAELKSTTTQIYERTDAERWPINPSVHFTNWEDFTKPDFIPVKEAFQDLHALFVCQNENCGSIIRVDKQQLKPKAVRCKCGKINWNLEPKK